METQAVSELFPLFNTANAETIEWLLSVAEEEEYEQDSVLVTEDTWGRAVFFIVSGWVKIRSIYGSGEATLQILSQGDYFGEMAVLDESLRAVDAIALSEVRLLSISAQRFIQILFKEPQLQHRMLQLTVRKLKHLYSRLQLQHLPPKIKLVKTLIFLSDNYGHPTEKGSRLLQISQQDLADIAGIHLEDTSHILDKLQSKGWIEIDDRDRALYLTNLRQLHHLAKQI